MKAKTRHKRKEGEGRHKFKVQGFFMLVGNSALALMRINV
jgi:hypothetical protein